LRLTGVAAIESDLQSTAGNPTCSHFVAVGKRIETGVGVCFSLYENTRELGLACI